MVADQSTIKSTLQQCNGKHLQHEDSSNNEISFGLLFDIDGVLGRGQAALQCAKDMFEEIKTSNGQLTIPLAFLTNSSSLTETKVNMIQNWFDIKISPDQLIQAPTPLKVFTSWHDKCILFVGQDNVKQIAAELGFKNVVVLDEIKEAYPLLDVVDHEYRRKLDKRYKEAPIGSIEAIVLLGEPIKWESHLQILVDLLVTNGKPDHAPQRFPEHHLPILVCNMDLVFMSEAVTPRFAHGAFLLCLESLYQKITGNKLNYTSMIGKPSEISFRYAEHIIALEARRMNIQSPIKSIYFFGDNPSVDIVGANLYNKYLQRFRQACDGKEITKLERQNCRIQASESSCRVFPEEAVFVPQTIDRIHSILVQTGVYVPHVCKEDDGDELDYSHRDFSTDSKLVNPTMEMENCFEGLKQIFEIEKYQPKH